MERKESWLKYFSSATAGFDAKVKNGGNKPFAGRVVSDLHLVYTFWFGKEHTSERENQRHEKNTVRLLGQKISIEWKALKTRDFDVFSNGVTPRLHLLKVNYPMNDESTLRDAGCFFYGWVAIKVANKVVKREQIRCEVKTKVSVYIAKMSL